ncbi:MAG TPA: isochorismate synthase [Propionibacteriaceae bacterium]|nr:isochorismate synthase [Propionibacteriaceae bacterium]
MTEDPIPPRLHARTVEIADPGYLPELMPSAGSYAWLRHGDGMVGWGEVVRHKATTIDEAEEWWRELCAGVVEDCELSRPPAGAGLMAFGSFVFDPANTSAQSALIVPERVIGRAAGRAWVTTIGTSPNTPWSPTRLPLVPPRSVSFADGELSGPEWEAVVAEAVRRINAGGAAGGYDLDKVVLARDLLAEADADLDPRWLVARLAADYSRCWTYLVDGLVGATPEMLIRREGGLATSRVLAGTIRRTGDDRRDLALAAALAQSSKDLEEHEYAVASVARALAPFCSGMHVPESPYVLELPNVLHLATDVTAVAKDPSSLALAAALHPSAAVCGTPTEAARETIREIEQLDRERYTGPVGWIDARGDGEWGIALRCGQISATDPRQIRLFAGCGIVAGSDPEAELAESNAKLVPMRDALGE